MNFSFLRKTTFKQSFAWSIYLQVNTISKLVLPIKISLVRYGAYNEGIKLRIFTGKKLKLSFWNINGPHHDWVERYKNFKSKWQSVTPCNRPRRAWFSFIKYLGIEISNKTGHLFAVWYRIHQSLANVDFRLIKIYRFFVSLSSVISFENPWAPFLHFFILKRSTQAKIQKAEEKWIVILPV